MRNILNPIESHNSGFTALGLIVRWHELSPEDQLKLIRQINHIASDNAQEKRERLRYRRYSDRAGDRG